MYGFLVLCLTCIFLHNCSLSTHHPLVNWQRNARFAKWNAINSYQSKSSFDIVNLLLWKEKAIQKIDGFHNLHGIPFLITFKSYDLIDSRRDLSKCFKAITWLRRFLCQLTHWWWVESNWCVISWRLYLHILMSNIWFRYDTMFVSYSSNTVGAISWASAITYGLIGVHFGQSLVFCVVFYRLLLVFCYFFFWQLHCLSSNYGFWLPLWCLQTFIWSNK